MIPCIRSSCVLLLMLALSGALSAQFSLTTTFIGGNGADGNMFDVMATSQIVIRGFDVNLDNGNWDVEVYRKRTFGTFVGSENDPNAWQRISVQRVFSAGAGVATALDLDLAVWLTPGQRQAFYVTVTTGGGINYTNGTAVGAVAASDGNLQIFEGVGKSYPFGSTFAPRTWNGTVRYALPLSVPSAFFGTIQAGINAAPAGGAVLVSAGTYNETLDWMGQPVAVVSRDGSLLTTVDAQGAGTTVTIDSEDAVLQGFTVTGGQGAPTDAGGVEAADGTLRGCIIQNCTGGNNPGPFGRGGAGGVQGNAALHGCVVRNNNGGQGFANGDGGTGGMYATQGSRLYGCLIENNDGGNSTVSSGGAGGFALDPIDTAWMADCELRGNDGGNGTKGGAGGMAWLGDSAGFFDRLRIHGNSGGNGTTSIGGAGGVDVPGGQGYMASSLIYGNTGGSSSGSRGGGGGFNFQFDTAADITHCTIFGNTGGAGGAGSGPGGALFFGVLNASPDVTNTIIWGNPGLEILEILMGPNAVPAVVTFSDIQGGWPGMGNISAAPIFTDPASGDFHLQAASPCFNAGTAAAPSQPALDFDRQSRNQFGAPDIGADEISAPFLPGSGEDLQLVVRINGSPDVQASAGDFFEATVFSPGFDFLGDPVAVLGQLFPNGMPPTGLGGAGIPYVHIDPASVLVLLDVTAGVLGPVVIPPSGVTVPYVVPMGLGGNTLRLQGVAFSTSALNGAFAATGAWDVTF